MDQVKGRNYSREAADMTSAKQKQKKTGKPWVNVLVRMLFVPFLLFISLLIGLLIGYSVIGDKPVSQVFDLDTYKHMYDLIFAGT